MFIEFEDTSGNMVSIWYPSIVSIVRLTHNGRAQFGLANGQIFTVKAPYSEVVSLEIDGRKPFDVRSLKKKQP